MAGEAISQTFADGSFVLLRAGIKFPPTEDGWQKPENAHSFQEALVHKGNIGILAGNGYIGLDKDHPEAFNDLILPPSTMWETRPGRSGMRFKCNDRTPEVLAKYGKKADQAQIKLFDGRRVVDGFHPAVGEVKLERTYQIIPPSWKEVDGQRVNYRMLEEIPPAEISLDWLLSELLRIGIVFSEKPKASSLEANARTLEGSRREAADRQLDKISKAKEFLYEAAMRAQPGHRNDTGLWLACQLRDLGLDAGEASEYMRKYAGSLEDSKAEPYTFEEAMNSLEQAYSREARAPPKRQGESGETKPKGPTVLDAFQKLLAHEDEIKENSWSWRRYKPRIEKVLKEGYLSFEGEEKAHKFLKNFKNILKSLGIDYDDLYPLLLKPKSNKEEFSEETKAKALDVLKNGDPVQYIADSCGKMVLGAEKAFKKLACCTSVQNVQQSAGLHPKFNGDSSGGKTITVYTFAHHMPKEAVVKGSMSAKSGFYHKSGDRVLRILDDYLAGNEDLDTVIKQTSSEFHETYTHRTVANHQAVTLKIGKEQTWAITSVDSSQEIQVLNRQLPINVDDSIKLTIEVNNRTIERYGNGEKQYPVNESVLVSRCMLQILRDEGYIDVKIPFWERIEWLDVSNRRNPSIFMDLVIAHTAMYRYQRARDSEGFYLATEADYNAAKALFTDKDGEELVKRLTARERDVIELLVANSEGLTRDDIVEKLKVSPERVSQILRGQKGNGGLMQKVQIKETKISLMERIDDDLKRTTHKTVYSLKDYDKFTGFDGVVRLNPPKPAPEEPNKLDKHGISNGISKQTNNGKNGISKISKKEKEREERDIDGLGDAAESSSRENEKKAYPAYAKAADSEKEAYVKLTNGLPDKPIKCAVCGEDLTGKGQLKMNGKYYCPKPGCGYPARVAEAT